jgi:glutathione S-transferase
MRPVSAPSTAPSATARTRPCEPQIREQGKRRLLSALEPLERQLQQSPTLVGDRFTIADAYLGVFCGWLEPLGPECERFEALRSFGERHRSGPR